jgi:hypothetical protein
MAVNGHYYIQFPLMSAQLVLDRPGLNGDRDIHYKLGIFKVILYFYISLNMINLRYGCISIHNYIHNYNSHKYS